ncbi:hypothetical protein ERJ75_000022100 [Trypanosoma vivax]|nr:hypothetical protein TRVL_03420 [Trypanosoma vivax]KAH8620844.1 hypothetical protein ERJ75_000022100 [Trypanosoma vivax]
MSSLKAAAYHVTLKHSGNGNSCTPYVSEVKPALKIKKEETAPKHIQVQHNNGSLLGGNLRHLLTHYVGNCFLEEKCFPDSYDTYGSQLSTIKLKNKMSIMDALNVCFATHVTFKNGNKEYSIPMYTRSEDPDKINVCALVALQRYLEWLLKDAGRAFPDMRKAFLSGVKSAEERGLISGKVCKQFEEFNEKQTLPPIAELAKASGTPGFDGTEKFSIPSSLSLNVAVDDVVIFGQKSSCRCNCTAQ